MLEHHWEPAVIGRLFLDDWDYEGLLKLGEDLQEMHRELDRKKKN
jgi:hypothetical protein